MTNNLCSFPEELNGPHDLGANHRMLSHSSPFLFVELTGLAYDAPAHADLPNVMHQGSYPNPSYLRLIKSHSPCQPNGNIRNILRVLCRVRILCVDRLGNHSQARKQRILLIAE